MKKLLIVLLVLAIIIFIAMFVFVGKMDSIVKDTIEAEGSAALGSPVRVESVVTNLKEGSALLTNLTIANPAGYSAKNAIEVTSFSANVDYSNQLIEEIDINKPIINAEQKGQKNNFQDLLENMPSDEEDVAEERDETVITIKRIALRNATINLITSDLSLGEKKFELGDRSFVMDDFIINSLSGTASEISDKVVEQLTSHVSSQVKDYLTKEISQIAKEKIIGTAKEKISEKVEEKLKNLKFKFGKK